MKKIISLIKATFTQDMNIFKYSANKNSKKITKILLPVILFAIVCVSIGSYAYMLAKPLHEIKLTYIMLTMFLFVVTILTFIEGIYKSQGILFEAKDNDMLFSLPIKKENILFIYVLLILIWRAGYRSVLWRKRNTRIIMSMTTSTVITITTITRRAR